MSRSVTVCAEQTVPFREERDVRLPDRDPANKPVQLHGVGLEESSKEVDPADVVEPMDTDETPAPVDELFAEQSSNAAISHHVGDQRCSAF